jgi:NADH-quinone oxidoreductase subunit G
VNTWWISDDTRYSYKAVHDDKRLKSARRVQYGSQVDTQYNHASAEADEALKRTVKESGPGSLYALLSPMMACEEVFLLGTYLRSIDPQALLVLGPVPTSGQNEVFKNSMNGKVTFTIQAEKVPNAAGVRRVMEMLGGPTAQIAELATNAKLKAGWIVGGYLSSWVTDALKLPKGFKVVQDILPSSLSDKADILLPAAAWAEKDGCWENFAGKIQPFLAAVPPPEGARREGDVYYRLLGRSGFFIAQDVRREMGEPFASIELPQAGVAEPAPEFVEL